MKTMSQLQDEKIDLEKKLKSLTSYREDGTAYYIDPEIAAIIKREIAYTLRLMEELATVLKDKIDEDESREKDKRREQRDRLFSSAKAFYDSQLEEYMGLSFWQKAQTMFKGKKPKKMSDREILETFGEEALNELIEERINSLLEDREEQLEEISQKYDTSSLQYFYIAHDVSALYDDKIERVRSGYYKELEDTIRASSTRKGK